MIKLDYIENIEIHDGITPLANYHSIYHLQEGIFMTYRSMKNLQTNYFEIAFPDKTEEEISVFKNSKLYISGDCNQADLMGMNLIHWYSINLINYVKSCALIKFLNKTGLQPERFVGDKSVLKELRNLQKEYMDSIPELLPVIHFRNKASAHLAYTDPKNDNAGTLVESMSLIPTYQNKKFTVGGLKRAKGNAESTFGENEWNLTDNFDSLIPRYFKNNFK